MQHIPALILLLFAVPAFAQLPRAADRVFWNGTIYTADAQQRVVEALATRDDRIIYVGDRSGANDPEADLQDSGD